MRFMGWPPPTKVKSLSVTLLQALEAFAVQGVVQACPVPRGTAPGILPSSIGAGGPYSYCSYAVPRPTYCAHWVIEPLLLASGEPKGRRVPW